MASPSPSLAFNPALLTNILQRLPPAVEPDSPFSLPLPSSLLFIDVSGFTALTESFVRSGASGLEQLIGSLNSYFASIIDQCQSRAGDLLKVAGDALLVAFYDEKEIKARWPHSAPSSPASPLSSPPADSLPLLCYRAVRCALTLQSTPPFTAAGVTLRLHIGVTCGLTEYIIVGGTPQWWPAAQSGAGDRGQGQDSSCSTPVQSTASPSTSTSFLPSSTVSSTGTSVRSSPLLLSCQPSTSSTTTTTTTSSFSSSSPDSAAASAVLSSPSSFHRPAPLQLPLERTAFLSRSPSLLPRAVGGGRWEFLAVGPAFQQLCSVVADSKTGDVVISAEVRASLLQVATVTAARLSSSSPNCLITACELIHLTDDAQWQEAVAPAHDELKDGRNGESGSGADSTELSSFPSAQ